MNNQFNPNINIAALNKLINGNFKNKELILLQPFHQIIINFKPLLKLYKLLLNDEYSAIYFIILIYKISKINYKFNF